jgi:hypothetical protein
VLPGRNLQFLQYIPELFSLKLGVHQMDGTMASQAPILRFNTIHLFTLPRNAMKTKSEEIMELEFAHMDEGLLAYPNPARDILQVSFTVKTKGVVTAGIYNLLGARVYHQEIVSSEGLFTGKIDVSGLQQGAYFLRIDQPEETLIRRISIVR